MTKINKKGWTIILLSFILLVLLIFAIYLTHLRDFSKVSLRGNDKNVFTIKDLSVEDINCLDNEKKVEKIFGKTSNDKMYISKNYSYKIKEYDGLKITLKENYEDYVVVKIELNSKKYSTGRDLKVGNKISKVMKKYKVENKKGNYIYGKYTLDNLKTNTITDSIYIGYRQFQKVTYYSRDELIDNYEVPLTARITYDYNTYGVVTKITWSYDVE